MSKMNISMAAVLWWPHSGGRWLSRSILSKHTQVEPAVFVHPWIFYSTDMTLQLDITAQVHKARSLPQLKDHLQMLKKATDVGRHEGLRTYFTDVRASRTNNSNSTVVVGEMCMGSPIPRYPDLKAIFKVVPDFKIVHLVRSPLRSFSSFATRHELDADPIKVAGSWLSLTSSVRLFFENNPQFKMQYRMIRYEDLIDSTDSTEKNVIELCEFLGLNFEPEMLDDIQERWGKSTNDVVSDHQLAIMREVAGHELDKYDY